LAAAASEAGLDGEKASAFATDAANMAAAREAARANSARGITGVPFFLINGEPIGSGAQPTEVLLKLLNEAEDE